MREGQSQSEFEGLANQVLYQDATLHFDLFM
jgi:hypothetical protein